ncbi:hypothetical protein TRFO_04750 [Tritrichomonas foetus]|uniref:Tetraspanin family protein n=1 Tax=Tritrichomonas foetus TaxID=1144522 RepID=A0A1J4KCM3_9EUKA|nr:hypothetical protein TRFO_04750 [Tritrichomonas foetus]|eukprot:OHT08688.1 hypothetical protein TRFO_04750 [Tritrichomonas foetus]
MASCKKCCTGTCFTILTIFTIGLTLGIFIFATIVYSKIRTVNDTIFIVIIIALCVTALVFIFGIYSSCCGNKCTKGILTFIYLIYALVLAALGISLLIFKNKLPGYFREAYDSGKFSKEDIATLEETFNCQFPESENGTSLLLNDTDTNQTDCFEMFESYVKDYGLWLGIALIILFVILFIGVVLACRLACKKDEESTGTHPVKEQVSTPLTYGW